MMISLELFYAGIIEKKETTRFQQEIMFQWFSVGTW
jgi:hypothetical protein